MICQTNKFNTEITNRRWNILTLLHLIWAPRFPVFCSMRSWHLVYQINYQIENSMRNSTAKPSVRSLACLLFILQNKSKFPPIFYRTSCKSSLPPLCFCSMRFLLELSLFVHNCFEDRNQLLVSLAPSGGSNVASAYKKAYDKCSLNQTEFWHRASLLQWSS